MLTIESLELELSELTAAYVLACDRIKELEGTPAPTIKQLTPSVTQPTIVYRSMPVHTLLHEYLPCAKTGKSYARSGKELSSPRDCAVVELPSGQSLAFRKRAHAVAWIDAGMPEFLTDW